MYEIIYNKAYIALTLSIIAVLAFRYRPWLEQTFAQQGEKKSFLVLAFLFRFLPFWVVYIFYGYDAQSDVQIFWRSAQEAKQLQFVYRDFDSLYSPLFAYITAIPLIFWDTARAVTLLMIVVELAVLWLTIKTYGTTNKPSNIFKALIYLCFPGPYIFCVLGGQEDIWMWGFACLVVYLWQKGKSAFILGLTVALGLLVTKAFFVLFVPPLFLKLSDKKNFVLGMMSLGLPSLAILYYFGGTTFLMPIQLAQEPMCPNVWSVMYPFLGKWIAQFNIRMLNWIGLFVIIIVSSWQAFRLKNLELKQFIPMVWVVIFGVMMLFQIGSYSNYIFIYAMPLLFSLMDLKNKKLLIISFLIQAAAVVQVSLWFRIGKPFLSYEYFLQIKFVIEYALELIVFFGVIYWLNMVLKKYKGVNA
jgi:hypothetical protein